MDKRKANIRQHATKTGHNSHFLKQCEIRNSHPSKFTILNFSLQLSSQPNIKILVDFGGDLKKTQRCGNIET